MHESETSTERKREEETSILRIVLREVRNVHSRISNLGKTRQQNIWKKGYC